jgi:hypothetical protein
MAWRLFIATAHRSRRVRFGHSKRSRATWERIGAPVKGLRVSRGLFRRRDRPATRAVLALSDLINQEVERLFATPRHVQARFFELTMLRIVVRATAIAIFLRRPYPWVMRAVAS